jgi:hypothetical protein
MGASGRSKTSLMKRLSPAVFLLFVGSIGSSCSQKAPATKAAVAPTTISHQVHVQKDRWSPHETICTLIDGNRVTITYGRPFRDDPVTHEPRPVWGGPHALVEYDKVWRLGADEATVMITQKSIEIGGVIVPAGAYTLFMMLQSDGEARLLVNREIGQWGIDPYHFDRELARIPLTKETIPEVVDQFTIAVERGSETGGVIKIIWDNLQFSIPFRVADTPDAAGRTASIRQPMGQRMPVTTAGTGG